MVKANGKRDTFDTDPGYTKSKSNTRYVEAKRYEDYQRSIEKELKRIDRDKVDDSGFQMLKDLAAEAKAIAQLARDKAMEPHECKEMFTLQTLKEKITGGNKLKIGGVITIILAVATFGTFLGMTTSSVAETQKDVSTLSETVHDNTAKITDLTKAVEDSQKANKDAANSTLEELKTISNTMKELTEITSKKRQR